MDRGRGGGGVAHTHIAVTDPDLHQNRGEIAKGAARGEGEQGESRCRSRFGNAPNRVRVVRNTSEK